MEYENDFVDEKPVELDIEGRKFKYKPTTGGDENEWLRDIMGIDATTKATKVNWSEYNKKKLANIMIVPYNKDLIQKVIGISKEWRDLNTDERYKVLGKLKPGLFDKLINAMKTVDDSDKEAVKN